MIDRIRIGSVGIVAIWVAGADLQAQGLETNRVEITFFSGPLTAHFSDFSSGSQVECLDQALLSGVGTAQAACGSTSTASMTMTQSDSRIEVVASVGTAADLTARVSSDASTGGTSLSVRVVGGPVQLTVTTRLAVFVRDGVVMQDRTDSVTVIASEGGGPISFFSGSVMAQTRPGRAASTFSGVILSLDIVPVPPIDTDGDGLLDSWETSGIDVDDDGDIDLDLPAMGADPLRKDIFVEVDRMSPLSFSPAAADIVIEAFAAAPVSNPDGSTGITMHIDNGPSSLMNPLTGADWGGLSRGNAVPFISILGTFDPSHNYNWAAFDAIKADHFPAERRPAFHYVIIGDRFGSAEVTASGISRDTDLAASDFLVTLGSFPVTGGTTFEQAGTFMHELGHNLGLRHGHGGVPEINNQPNFLSIMNYAFQHTGLFYNGNIGLFDYSRFGPESLGQLNEPALSELNGFQAAPSLLPYKTAHFCAAKESFQLVDVVALIDWNCVDGFNPDTVAEDINDDGVLTTMDPFDDWSHLVYRGGLIGGLGAGAALPGVTPVIEPPLSEILKTTRVLAPFDLYLDGRIDLRDFALFQECFASKAGGADGRCLAADFDADGVVDGTDHGPLANALTGP